MLRPANQYKYMKPRGNTDCDVNIWGVKNTASFKDKSNKFKTCSNILQYTQVT